MPNACLALSHGAPFLLISQMRDGALTGRSQLTGEAVPRAGAGFVPDARPAVAAVLQMKHPTMDRSWRTHHRERKVKWTPPRPKIHVDQVALMITVNQERNQQLAVAKRDEARAQAAEVTRILQRQVMPEFRPPPGKLWGVNEAAQLVVGPAGGIGITSAVAHVLGPLAVRGRHDEAGFAAAVGCRDVAHLREMLTAMAGKLAAIGLRVDRRKVGIRITKAR